RDKRQAKAKVERTRLDPALIRKVVALSVASLLLIAAVTAAYRAYRSTTKVDEFHDPVADEIAAEKERNDPIVSRGMSRQDGKIVTTITSKSGKVEISTEHDLRRPVETPVTIPKVKDIEAVNAHPTHRPMSPEDMLKQFGGSVALVRGLRGASSGYL